MGLRDHLRRRLRERHQRESAISTQDLEAIAARVVGDEDDPGDVGAEPPTAGEPEPMTLPGASPAELAQMIGRAIAAGTPQISTGSHRIEGADQISDEILALLAGAGALRRGQQEEPGFEIDPGEAEQLLEQVRVRLAELEDADEEPS